MTTVSLSIDAGGREDERQGGMLAPFQASMPPRKFIGKILKIR